MSETAADTLRRAANLMRERARLVPASPWFSAVHDVTTYDGLDVIASSGLTVRSQYVASWHPLVAAFVADWLDAEAAALWDPPICTYSANHALDVARAYLGETT
jgi:hypothetical protein